MEQIFAGWTRRIEAAFADEFPDCEGVRVDRLKQHVMGGDRGLWQLRVRWREGGEPHTAELAMRLCTDAASCAREAEALAEASRAGLSVPTVWLTTPDDPPCLLFDWIDGQTVGSLYRQRDKRASAELLAELLVELHDRTERGGQALCHGDYRPSNVLLDRRGEPVVVGWGGAHWGDPIRDVARAVAAIESDFGGLLRAPFLRAYRRQRPVPPDRLEALLQSLGDANQPAPPDTADRARRGRDAARPAGGDHPAGPSGDPQGE